MYTSHIKGYEMPGNQHTCLSLPSWEYLCLVLPFFRLTWLQNSAAFFGSGGESKGEYLLMCTLGNPKHVNHFILLLLPLQHRFEAWFTVKTEQKLASLCSCPVPGDLHQSFIVLPPGMLRPAPTLWEYWQWMSVNSLGFLEERSSWSPGSSKCHVKYPEFLCFG